MHHHASTRFGRVRRIRRAAALAAAAVLTIGGTAVADDVYNQLDASIDATAESLAMSAGGSTEVLLYIDQTNGDGKNGCNLSGTQGSELVIDVASSDATVATAQLTDDTFTSCGDTATVRIAALKSGATTVSVSQAALTGAGSFNYAPATFTVEVAAAANTAPAVTVTGVADGEYAKGSVPAAGCSVVDAEDEGETALPVTTGDLDGDGLGEQTVTCTYTDGGGLTRSASVTYTIVDPTPPAIGYVLDPAAPDGQEDWYTGTVTLTWTVSEPESPGSLVTVGCADQVITSDQLATSYTCSASSSGGEADEQSVNVKRDGNGPAVSLVGGPQDGASYYFGSVPAPPTCSSSDDFSGVVAGACAVTGYSTAVGSHHVTASDSDRAGNEGSATHAYDVLAWTTKGFYQPVDMNGVVNKIKGGSTVPLKFELFAGPTELTDVAAVKSFTYQATGCSATAPVDAVELTTTGGTVLRYDATGGQFVQNWKVPTALGCYTATMTAQDGSSVSAKFQVTK